MTSESTLSSQLGTWPSLGTWQGPWTTWITELSGVIVVLVLQTIPFKKKLAPSPVADFETTASSNPIVATLEEGIRDHILARMQSEIIAASHRYDWKVIKSVAHRTMEEEITVGRLGREEAEVAIHLIEAFQGSTDQLTDSDKKYTALVRMLRWCSFNRLRHSLAAAAVETQP